VRFFKLNGERIVNREKLLSYSAVLSILVVLIHTENIASYGLTSDTSLFGRAVCAVERLLSGNIAKIGVPSFFMLSGLLFYRDFDFSKYPKKMKNRFFSLFVPYLLWNFLRFALFYALGKLHITEQFLHADRVVFTWENFFGGVFFYKYNLGYWFMYQLILYTVLCPAIFLLLRKKPVALISLAAVFILFCTDALGELSMTVFHKKFLQIDGLFYYMLGAFVGMHHFDIINKKSARITCLAFFGMLLGQVFFVLFSRTYILTFHILFCTVSAISFWYLFDSLFQNPLPKCLTTITFFIYSAHGTILEFSQAAFSAIFPATPFVALLEYMLLPCTTLALIAALAWLLKRYLNPAWRLLNGSR